jgi:hypothetical protein
MIGAVTSNRSSLADSAPQQNTSAATMARSETLIVPPLGLAPAAIFRRPSAVGITLCG